MWLINTTTLRLEYFAVPENAPPYAILSHTWGDEELSFAQFQSLKDSEKDTRGYQKIYKTCELARASDIQYAWVDTCCIDKSSSAELTEAINSMYDYYRRSEICYAYIDDWEPGKEWHHLAALGPHNDALRWFTRGWTLQELIAPSNLEFYNASWTSKGFKKDGLIPSHLSRITGIAISVLGDGSEANLNSVCLAQRMSWAAHRNTSRIEDTAYCLMGIFQINMPLLYGEGDRAFLRFQQEIIKNTTDLSLFAWESDTEGFTGISASTPRQFAQFKTCQLSRSQFYHESELAITNKGLRLHTTPLTKTWDVQYSGLHYLDLGCTTTTSTSKEHRFIVLFNVSENVYCRYAFISSSSDDIRFMIRAKPQVLYIVQEHARAIHYSSTAHRLYISFLYNSDEPLPDGIRYRLEPTCNWPPSRTVSTMHAGMITMAITSVVQFNVGYVKLNVVAQSPAPTLDQLEESSSEGDEVDHVVVAYSGYLDGQDVFHGVAGLLEPQDALDFVELAGSVENVHPQAAEERVRSYVRQLESRGGFCKQLEIRDAERGRALRVSVKREPASGFESRFIELSVDEISAVEEGVDET